MTATPRPKKLRTWTQADHDDNKQRIQRDADRRTWDRLGKLVGIRGRELTALLARFMDDRIAAALRAHNPPLLEQLKAPADAAALRDALFECISDDVVEMFQLLTGQDTTHECRDTEETPGSGRENATFVQREIYGDEAEET